MPFRRLNRIFPRYLKHNTCKISYLLLQKSFPLVSWILMNKRHQDSQWQWFKPENWHHPTCFLQPDTKCIIFAFLTTVRISSPFSEGWGGKPNALGLHPHFYSHLFKPHLLYFLPCFLPGSPFVNAYCIKLPHPLQCKDPHFVLKSLHDLLPTYSTKSV